MKMLKIFLRDIKVNLHNFLSIWILLIPVILAIIINIASPGITDSILSVALLEDAPVEQVAFYQQYAAVEQYETETQIENRVMGRDFCIGVLPDSFNRCFILAQGNEPASLLDTIRLLKTYEERGEAPSVQVSFSDFGRTVPPLKSTLITGLLMLVTILSGMLIALGIVDEKSDKTIRAIKVTPVSTTSFVIGKSLIGIAYTLVCSFAILLVSGYLSDNILQILLVLLSSSFISLLVGFLIGLTSDDFIAAAGNVKLLMIPAVIPILVTELAPAKWHFLVWWSPFFWSYDAIKGLLNQATHMDKVLMDCGIVIAIALVVYLVLIPKVRQKLK